MDASHWRRGYGPSSIINPVTGTGWHIAYHYFIGKDGTVLQTRPDTDRTEHTSCGMELHKCVSVENVNDQSLAVVLAGDFTQEQPTTAQVLALRKLVADLDAKYHFARIMPHRDASPTSCPGQNLINAVKDLFREPDLHAAADDDVYDVSRYYSPVPGQQRYYRKEGYLADVKVNCGLNPDGTAGDCFSTADGHQLTEADAYKVAACPPEMPLGTKLQVEGIGQVLCRDHGSAIRGKRLDLWAGVGDAGLQKILTTPSGARHVRVL